MDGFLTDTRLVEQIRAGNKPAFKKLFNRYYAPLCRFSLKYTRSKSATEDIVQALFVRVWETREQWKPTSPKSYLYAAVRNRSITEAERDRRSVVFDPEVSRSKEQSPTAQIEHNELRIKLNKAIAELSPRQREVFHLSRNGNLSHKEIARTLDISLYTVETHIARALKKLHDCVQ